MEKLTNEQRAERAALAKKYTAEWRERKTKIINALGEDEQEFLRNTNGKLMQELEKFVKGGKKPSEFLEKKCKWLFTKDVIAKRDKKALLYMVDECTNFIYMNGWGRRTFRSADYSLYLKKIDQIISQFFNWQLYEIDDYADLLEDKIPAEVSASIQNSYFDGEYILAYEIDRGNERVINFVRDALSSGSSSALSERMFLGVFMSKNTELYELAGKLLLAAQLQEGLRQAVCEAADSGRIEPFLMILKVIRDNNLIRFSSVKRAVGVWTGMLTEESKDLDRISGKTLDLIIECLDNPKAVDECLSGEDTMKIYIALWALACREIHDAEKKLEELLENGTSHQALTAGVFLANDTGTEITQRLSVKAVLQRHDELDVMAVWVPLMSSTNSYYASYQRGYVVTDMSVRYTREDAEKLYVILNEMLEKMPKGDMEFSPCVFPWYSASLTKRGIVMRLCVIAADLDDDDKIDETVEKIPLIKGGSYNSGRNERIKMLLSNPRTEKQLDTLVSFACDKEEYSRKAVFEILSKIKLQDKHYMMLEDMLKYKAADMRQSLIDMLFKQSEDKLLESAERLISDKKEEKRTAGLDIIIRVTESDKNSEEVKSKFAALAEKIEDPSAKEKILVDRILSDKDSTDDSEGFGLYKDSDDFTPEVDIKFIEECKKEFVKTFPTTPLFGNKPGKKKLGLLEIMNALDKLIEKHKNDEYLDSGSGNAQLLADESGFRRFKVKLEDGTEQIAFKTLWDEFYAKNINDEDLLYILKIFCNNRDNTPKLAGAMLGAEFAQPTRFMHPRTVQEVMWYYSAEYQKKPRLKVACALAYYIGFEAKVEELYDFAPHPYGSVDHVLYIDGKRMEIKGNQKAQIFTPVSDGRMTEVMSWLNAVSDITAEHFKDVFSLRVKLGCRFAFFAEIDLKENRNYQITKQIYQPFTTASLILAAYKGVVTQGYAYKMLMTKLLSNTLSDMSQLISFKKSGESRAVSRFYSYNNGDFFIWSLLELRERVKLSEYELTDEDKRRLDYAAEMGQKIIDTVLNVELVRGDTETQFSRNIGNIRRIYGAENFVRVLTALGKDTLVRSTYFSSYNGVSKKQSLSFLLGVCVPNEDDTPAKLKKLIKGTGITDNRLVEAALYSTPWLDIIGNYLGWEGFKSACFYFIAHMNESLDEKTQAMIAKYTPLSMEELNVGAFDSNWFKDALAAIGEKRFDSIYKAAKYISDGAKHTRARKYADAVMGKLTKSDATSQVTDKRNKDTLMAYALIPLDGEKDMVERYLFIQEFKKQSKKFGAQRKASEGAAADCALKNLATNAGFADVSRLTLRMEAAMFENMKPLFDWVEIDEIKLKLEVDENGSAEIKCEKGGKALKSVPSKYTKNEKVQEFTAAKKQLVEQYRRTRQMFEEAMENATEFTAEELNTLCANLAIKPLLERLVYKTDKGKLGFLNGYKLTDFDGKDSKLTKTTVLKVAHPFDLYTDGHWHEYQKYLFDNAIAQPFKQVFRELYVKTDEEAEAFRSTRYAGNQIQPLKAKACLKSRRWVADYEAGLQKVYYKENIIATIYALADWFSPADIEAPTLEWVEFYDRKNGKALRISEVPDIIFSEVMRDVDLVVSVAHAGDVDPETSHSTIEMRKAIIEFTLPLFKLENVRLEGSHAFITGERADYSIHLGSGVVHRQGGPMINVLPVHSQHRGKLFLPFVDEDPKTAQIISEILLFAEDKKIKDPFILDQL